MQDRVLGLCQLGMRKGIGENAEEGLPGCLLGYPFHRLAVYHVGRIVLALFVFIAMHGIGDIVLKHLTPYGRVARCPAIGIEEVGIVQMSLELAHETVILIYSPLVGSRLRTLIATGPLAKHACRVAVVAHDLGQDDMGGVVGFLTGLYGVLIVAIESAAYAVFPVATYLGVSCVLSGHEGRTRGSADRASGIGLGKAYALGSHAVEVGCADILLSITAYIGITKVVAHYIYYIRLTGSRSILVGILGL